MDLVRIHGLDGPHALVQLQIQGLHVRRSLYRLHGEKGEGQVLLDLVGDALAGSRDGRGAGLKDLAVFRNGDGVVIPGKAQLGGIHLARQIQGPGAAQKIQIHLDVAGETGVFVRFYIQLGAEDALEIALLLSGCCFFGGSVIRRCFFCHCRCRRLLHGIAFRGQDRHGGEGEDEAQGQEQR